VEILERNTAAATPLQTSPRRQNSGALLFSADALLFSDFWAILDKINYEDQMSDWSQL